jgi:hypothetical protein
VVEGFLLSAFLFTGVGVILYMWLPFLPPLYSLVVCTSTLDVEVSCDFCVVVGSNVWVSEALFFRLLIFSDVSVVVRCVEVEEEWSFFVVDFVTEGIGVSVVCFVLQVTDFMLVKA